VSEQGIGRVPTNDPADLWFVTGSRHQSYAPDPFFLSSHGFGLQADTSRRSIFSMCSDPRRGLAGGGNPGVPSNKESSL